MWKTILFALFLWPCYVFAADINLTLHQQSLNDKVIITITNNSNQVVVIDSVYIELDNQLYKHPSKEIIPANSKKAFPFKINLPSLIGSYPLTVTVRYLNDGQVLTLRHVGIFYLQIPAMLATSCSIENTIMGYEGDVVIVSDNPEIWKIILPDELEVVSSKTLEGRKVFNVKSRVSGFKITYPVFAVAEDERGGIHRTGICIGTIMVDTTRYVKFQRGRMPSGVLLALSAIFLIIAFCVIKKDSGGLFITALGKYASRMFLISLSYYLLKNFDSWMEFSLRYISFKPYVSFAGYVIDSLRGVNYQYFFSFFVDAYFALCLLFVLPYFYWFDRDKSLVEDKYTSFLKTLLSLPGIFVKKRIYWSKQSKLGMLTIFVKFYFSPIMVSWSINNILHIKNLVISPPQWNLYTINSFLVDLFILIDTTIFAFGYLVEARFLKNEIKSVEPTFLGWLVCLCCYPPFNQFFFKPFDYQFIDITVKNYPAWFHAVLTCTITFLWFIFVWASVALGFKASNLTNRGIVSSGPYRFVRHPAYTSKVLIWIIQGVFFAQFTIGILIAFTIIYWLRAWTEERHLSMDPDYVEYKSKVKWRFIPGVF